jgi:hypothetical protein
MRRNEPCHCGSGKRFKHCHGRLGSEAEDQDLLRKRQEAALHERRLQQGFGKSIQSYALKDRRAVVIGRALMVGGWQTFTDFLLDYFAERIGRQWIANEMRLAEAAHPIALWAIEMRKQAAPNQTSGIAKRTINNAFRSLLSTAYNLYLIEHHYEQYDQPLFERLLNRLRVRDGFFAALSETNAAAAFLKAGFFLEYEDDLRPGQHAEFTATYPPTSRRFSVEVKTRSGVDSGGDLKTRLRLKNKLSQALKKTLSWTRVVFIDLNVPEVIADAEDPALDELLEQIEEAERTLKIKGTPAPPAYLFLINQPFHYNLASIEGAPLIGAFGFKLDTFQPRAATFRQVILGRELHPEMHRLIESMQIHGEPPSTFDGQHPEFTFDPAAGQSRWLVGNEYLVPALGGKEVMARLQSGSVSTATKIMHGVFQADGINFVVQAPMTDAELAAFSRSPETFFGVVQNVGRQANNAFELAEFFYENYKNTTKENLLEFLKDHPAIEMLRNLSQSDLAIFVCEQWALSADTKR